MARKAKVEKKSSALFDALKFVSLAQSDKGAPYQTHCILNGKTVTTFDGMIACGSMLDEEFSIICPQTAKLQAALDKCGANFSIVADQTALVVKTDKLKVYVPCLPWDVMQFANPDPATHTLTNDLLKGFAAVAPLAENGTGFTSSILLRSGSVLTTDRIVMLEYWHGLTLPELALPKAAIAAILKAGKPLASLGHSEGSATFWFVDGSWLRTQLSTPAWPDVRPILDRPANPWPVPVGLFDGVRAILAHSEQGFIYFDANRICSHSIEKQMVGASYECQGVVKGPIFNGKRLLQLEPYIKKIDFVGNEKVSLFYGDNLRGAIVQCAPAIEPETQVTRQMTPEERTAHDAYMAEVRRQQYNDPDIPF